MRTILLAALLLVSTLPTANAQGAEPGNVRGGIASVLPADWTLEPRDPNWSGKRFVSPDRRAWLAIYEARADGDTKGFMDSVAFAHGERVTYSRRGRGWVVSSGFKGDRIFYRKAMLACGDAAWHQIAFEYPAAEKRAYDRFVTLTEKALAAHRNDGCPKTAPR
jgi:serine/threonine-protein kinase